MIYFYDTCSLLDLQDDAFTTEFVISSITISELEQIKTSGTKDEEVKWSARELLRKLEDNQNKYEIVLYNTEYDEDLKKYGFIINNDSRIIITAFHYNKNNDKDIVFVTSDLSCKKTADALKLNTLNLRKTYENDNYTAFKIITYNDEELADFYNNILVNNDNIYRLLTNQYLIIKFNESLIDQYRWTEEGYAKVEFQKEESLMFGKVLPKDAYQQIAMDSLKNNQITMLRGPAGTGKSLIAFAHMFTLLEHGKVDKLIIFCNTVATKGSAKLGFYPGSRTEKLLDSQIGNLLESKLGDRSEVEKLIDEGKIILLPMSDIRGYDTTGMAAAIYISEAQNLDIELMRLALQRIGNDSTCILDGDFSHQVDMSIYAGSANGMRRVSQVFRGENCYGEVELQNIYRSKIAQIAEKL